MDASLSWNSLEIAKLAVAALTPLVVAAIGFVVIRGHQVWSTQLAARGP
jgi:hypothetical protein